MRRFKFEEPRFEQIQDLEVCIYNYVHKTNFGFFSYPQICGCSLNGVLCCRVIL